MNLLNTVGKGLSTRVPAAGDLLHHFDRDLEVVALEVPEAHLLFAAHLYGPALRALQVVWSDARGMMPWAHGFRGGTGGQPVLGPRAVRAA